MSATHPDDLVRGGETERLSTERQEPNREGKSEPSGLVAWRTPAGPTKEPTFSIWTVKPFATTGNADDIHDNGPQPSLGP